MESSFFSGLSVQQQIKGAVLDNNAGHFSKRVFQVLFAGNHTRKSNVIYNYYFLNL